MFHGMSTCDWLSSALQSDHVLPPAALCCRTCHQNMVNEWPRQVWVAISLAAVPPVALPSPPFPRPGCGAESGDGGCSGGCLPRRPHRRLSSVVTWSTPPTLSLADPFASRSTSPSSWYSTCRARRRHRQPRHRRRWRWEPMEGGGGGGGHSCGVLGAGRAPPGTHPSLPRPCRRDCRSPWLMCVWQL